MKHLLVPGSGRRTLAGLGPRMTAFVVADAVLLLAFVVFLVLSLTGSIGAPATTGGAATTVRPSGAAPAAAAPAPPSASTSAASTRFALPSRNIGCEITAKAATCTIASSTASPPAVASCKGSVGQVLTVTASGASTPCIDGPPPGPAAPDASVLGYGQSTTAGDFTCTSSSTGVTCKHDPSGKGFQLARAGSKLF
jgi:hypothetical protein